MKGTSGYGRDSDEGDNHAEDDDQRGDGDYGNEPHHAFAGRLLLRGRLDDLFLGLLGVVECRGCVLVYLNHNVTLVVHLGMDLLGDLVNVRHEVLDGVELLLAILDQIGDLGRFNQHFALFKVKLLLLLL